MATLARWVLAVVLVSGGVAGLVLPGLPGAPLLFLGLLVAAWAEEFAYVGWKTLTVVGMMALATYPVDLAATLVGVRGFGASGRAAVGAMLGLVVGLFFGLPGVLLGPFVGAVLGELSIRRDLAATGYAGLGATLGLALGIAAKLALGVGMVGVFLAIRLAAG